MINNNLLVFYPLVKSRGKDSVPRIRDFLGNHGLSGTAHVDDTREVEGGWNSWDPGEGDERCQKRYCWYIILTAFFNIYPLLVWVGETLMPIGIVSFSRSVHVPPILFSFLFSLNLSSLLVCPHVA